MNKLKFVDGTIINIEDGATLGEVVYIADNDPDAIYICSLITPANVNHLEFLIDENVVGVYDNIAVAAPATRENGDGETVIVRMHFREKDPIEVRVDALEESREIQDGAIEDIGAALSDIAEG